MHGWAHKRGQASLLVHGTLAYPAQQVSRLIKAELEGHPQVNPCRHRIPRLHHHNRSVIKYPTFAAFEAEGRSPGACGTILSVLFSLNVIILSFRPATKQNHQSMCLLADTRYTETPQVVSISVLHHVKPFNARHLTYFLPNIHVKDRKE